MTDIYLSYSEPNLALAQDLKQEVESCSSLSVALEDHDWEETDECDFQEHIDQAKMFILIATPSSNITAWVIDHNKSNKRRSLMKPPTVDFSSYEDGMRVLKYVLRRVIGSRPFQNRRPAATKEATKDKKPEIPQRSTSVSNEDDSQQASSSFAEPNHQLPAERKSNGSLLEAIADGFSQMLQRGLGSTMDL
ncbi:unnamed protein product [Cylindrotheca closterium]|uniref:TIR domain-containing protein n=1 Tax=Cylindrotheca closterium TaxID=2856 RepID=A0AAD2FMW7_9STRA|nr:unnamed protein product [Cylindrotheca closterium]